MATLSYIKSFDNKFAVIVDINGSDFLSKIFKLPTALPTDNIIDSLIVFQEILNCQNKFPIKK